MYQIGQVRRNQINSYSTSINYSLGLIRNEDSAINFYDPCIYLAGASVVTSLNSYYLKFEVMQMINSPQNFTIKLKNSGIEVDNIHIVRNFNVKKGMESTVFELIFNPNSNYNEIIFELDRLALDFNISNPDGTSGRIMNVRILDFYMVNNIISNNLSSMFLGLTTLKKIGIQGPPGLLFVIDGEEMRIGRTGIYELYDDEIVISYIGFIIKRSLFTQDGKDFFIMDFKY